MERRKGFKAFTWALGSRFGKGMLFRVGGTYHAKGEIELCSNGFHWCDSLSDCYNWYPINISTRICEIEAWGNTEGYHSAGKFASRYIHIVRELSFPDILSELEKTDDPVRDMLLRSWETYFSMPFMSDFAPHRRAKCLLLACRADPFRVFRIELRRIDTGSRGYLRLPGHVILGDWHDLLFGRIWADESVYGLVSWKGTGKWVESEDDIEELRKKLPCGCYLMGGYATAGMINVLRLIKDMKK